MNWMKTWPNTFYLSVLLLFCVNISFAQDFEVSPAALNFALEPREIGTKKVKVTNHSNKKAAFKVTISDMTYDKDGNEVSNLPAGSVNNSLANWLNIFPTYFELGPNETKFIDVNLSIPANEFETKWAILYVQSAEERGVQGADKQLSTGIIVTPRIRVMITNSPKSNNKYKGQLSNFKEIEANEQGQRQFAVDVKNVGGKNIEPKIFLMAANLETGKEYRKNAGAVALYPSQKRTVNMVLDMNLPAGNYAIAAVMDYGHNSSLEVVQMQITVK